MYLYDKNRVTYFAETDRRNKRIPFGIKADDRTRHMYIIGKTGMGKSTMIENMAVQDIKNGEGLAFIDPHGKSAALLLNYIPPERIKDVIYFAPFDMDNPISFNIMEDIGADRRHLVANGLMSVFKKLWLDAWSARMEYILSNVLLALLEYPDSTLLGVNRMLADKAYRKKVVDNIKDPAVKAFWIEEYAKYSDKYAAEAAPAIQNKIGQFTSNPLIRNIIGQPHSSFDLRKIMDERKILIVNLSKGQVGDGNANLLGSMLITKIYLAALSRAELTETELKKLPNFYMYVDEFQSFANESFANILSEARKYKLSLIMAHQYIEQMSEEVTAAVFGNVGTQIMFRVGATDAEHLEKEYAPVFTAEDMVNLGFTQIYLKLMIDGVASHPFSAVTMPPILPPQKSSMEEVILSSRELYAHPRLLVEQAINAWYGTDEIPALALIRTDKPMVVVQPTKQVSSSLPKKDEVLKHNSTGSSRLNDLKSKSLEAVAVRDGSPMGSDTSPQNHKTEKLFAQAFKNIIIPPESAAPKELARHDSEESKISLSLIMQKKPSFETSKTKGPSGANLNTLKAALSEAMNPTRDREGTQRPKSLEPEAIRDGSPVGRTSISNEMNSQGEKHLENKQQASKIPEPSIIKKQEEIKAREVPEDLLKAILKGED